MLASVIIISTSPVLILLATGSEVSSVVIAFSGTVLFSTSFSSSFGLVYEWYECDLAGNSGYVVNPALWHS